MQAHQKIKEMCPFCEQEVLDVLWWPSHKGAHTSQSAAAGSKTTFKRKPEGHELLSEECPNCGKTKQEIERAWKEGVKNKKVDYKKRLEELKKLGLSGVIKG